MSQGLQDNNTIPRAVPSTIILIAFIFVAFLASLVFGLVVLKRDIEPFLLFIGPLSAVAVALITNAIKTDKVGQVAEHNNELALSTHSQVNGKLDKRFSEQDDQIGTILKIVQNLDARYGGQKSSQTGTLPLSHPDEGAGNHD